MGKVKTDVNVVALSEQAAPASVALFDFDDSVVLETLTRPTLSYRNPGDEIGFRVTSNVYTSEENNKGETVELIDVDDLRTGMQMSVVVSAILGKTLAQLESKHGTIIGECLALRNAGSKRTRDEKNVTLCMIKRLDPAAFAV